jgi:hypothetical protein
MRVSRIGDRRAPPMKPVAVVPSLTEASLHPRAASSSTTCSLVFGGCQVPCSLTSAWVLITSVDGWSLRPWLQPWSGFPGHHQAEVWHSCHPHFFFCGFPLGDLFQLLSHQDWSTLWASSFNHALEELLWISTFSALKIGAFVSQCHAKMLALWFTISESLMTNCLLSLQEIWLFMKFCFS